MYRNGEFYTLEIGNFSEGKLLELFMLILETNSQIQESYLENGKPSTVVLAIPDKKVEEFRNDGFEITKSLPDDAEIHFVMFSTNPGLI